MTVVATVLLHGLSLQSLSSPWLSSRVCSDLEKYDSDTKWTRQDGHCVIFVPCLFVLYISLFFMNPLSEEHESNIADEPPYGFCEYVKTKSNIAQDNIQFVRFKWQ